MSAQVSTTNPDLARQVPQQARPRAEGTGLRVLQIPERCGWNPYVASAESALTSAGATVLRPGWCPDEPGAGRVTIVPDLDRVRLPHVVHLHWPEKLAAALGGTHPAMKLLETLVAGGAVIVQTVHNIAAHEPTPELLAYRRSVDQLTGGIICFSAEHETLARAQRPLLPAPVLHLKHPLFPVPGPEETFTQPKPGGLRIGCFGRLRDYKRTVSFAHAFTRQAPEQATLLIAGACEDPGTDGALRAIASCDRRVRYRPGFAPERDFWQTMTEVDWVALPYQALYSSGMLIAGLQSNRRILSPVPVGGTRLYLGSAAAASRWTALTTWDDDKAILRARHTAWLPVQPGTPELPSWDDAGGQLRDFYRQVLAARRRNRIPGPAIAS